MISDNGVQFSSHKFTEHVHKWGINHQLTAERANRRIKTMIAQFTGNQHTRWDESLPEIALATSSSWSELDP